MRRSEIVEGKLKCEFTADRNKQSGRCLRLVDSRCVPSCSHGRCSDLAYFGVSSGATGNHVVSRASRACGRAVELKWPLVRVAEKRWSSRVLIVIALAACPVRPVDKLTVREVIEARRADRDGRCSSSGHQSSSEPTGRRTSPQPPSVPRGPR